jgi:hypothetical protein
MGRKTKIYARVERKLWRNYIFRNELSDDARLLWVYLMTTFREAHLPGLVETTILIIMEDLGWHERGIPADIEEHEKIVIGIKRTQAALDEVILREWVHYSKVDRLLMLNRGVVHNLPANVDVVAAWTSTLAEFPDTETKRQWVKKAVSVLRRTYGKDDARYKRLKSYWYSMCQPPLDDSKLSENIEESDSRYTRCGPPAKGKKPEVNEKGTHGVVPTNTNTNTNTITDHKHNTKRGGGDDVSQSAPKTPQKAKPSPRGKKLPEKPKTAPEDFTPRQVAFYQALQQTEFYVRGQTEDRTAWQIVKDPVRLARNLGAKDTFPLVEVGLIGRLGAWSFENKAKAKTDIGRFILNRARANQEHPPRGQNGQSGGAKQADTTSARRRYGDLQAKTGG